MYRWAVVTLLVAILAVALVIAVDVAALRDCLPDQCNVLVLPSANPNLFNSIRP